MNAVEFQRHFDRKAKEAVRRNTGIQLIKVSAGSYLTYRKGELIEVYRRENGEWMCKEINNKWYSDPYKTLKALKINCFDVGS